LTKQTKKTSKAANNTNNKPIQAEKIKVKGIIREYAEVIILALVLAMFIRVFVVQTFKIPSGSMVPTLLVGDQLMVNKFIYGIKLPIANKTIIPIKAPKRGDIIVFPYPLDPKVNYIKRVMGLAGETIEVKNKVVYINGKKIDDPYAYYTSPPSESTRNDPGANFGPVTVPENSLFMMGDNRDNSSDSRFWGFVDVKTVRGKAFLIHYSWDSQDWGIRWGRLGKILR
jgi:signal peptidase I